MIERRPVTLLVAAAVKAGSGKPVGLGKIPTADDGITAVNPPYHILYSMPLALGGAPLADMNEDVTLTYQVTSVSGPDPAIPQSVPSVEQAEWMADKARTALLGRDPATGLWLHTIAPAGWSCMGRRLDIEPGAADSPQSAIISYVQRFQFDLTPN